MWVDVFLNLHHEVRAIVTSHHQSIVDAGKVARGKDCVHDDADDTC